MPISCSSLRLRIERSGSDMIRFSVISSANHRARVMGGEHALHAHRERRVVQAAGRQVDGDAKARRVAVADPIGKGPVHGERRQRRDQSGVLGQPDEVLGQQAPLLRMVPSEQSLDGRHASGIQVDDWLVVQHELLAVDTAPQGRHE